MHSSFLKSHEFVILCAIIIFSAAVSLVNPEGFLSLANLFDVLKNSAIFGILSLGVLMVILTGGVDLSFTAVGCFAAYASVLIFKELRFTSLIGIYALAVCIGTALGAVNGFLVHKLRAPAMIVTLGTASMIYSFMLFVFGSTIIFQLPRGLRQFSNASLATVQDPLVGSSSLHPIVLIWLVLALLIHLLLKHTMFGRYIYALGGSPTVCERSGVNIFKLNVMLFSLVGALSGIAAISFASMFRMASPTTFRGQELDVIAAVVLGGTLITGGKGSVLGALLGVILISLIKGSLIMLGIPSEWQKLIVGFLLLIGVAGPIVLPKLRQAKAQRI